MIWKNQYNLPEPLFMALTNDDYTMGDADISVTGLIKPPRIRILEKRHDTEIVKDASEMLWSVLGKVGHKILEGYEPERGITEERLFLDVGGWRVSGKPDLWHEPHTLQDYKYTSIWAYIYGLKSEWEQQLNMYAPFYKEAGFPVKKLDVVAIFRDHKLRDQMNKKDYPPQCAVMPVPVWDDVSQRQFTWSRVKQHQAAELFKDDKLPYCTPEERWEQPTKYAVMKKGGKRSVRNLESNGEAEKYIEKHKDKAKLHIEVRLGESTRCIFYCDCKPFCNQWKEMNR